MAGIPGFRGYYDMIDPNLLYHGTDSDTFKYIKDGGLKADTRLHSSGYGESRVLPELRIHWAVNASFAHMFADRRITRLAAFQAEDAGFPFPDEGLSSPEYFRAETAHKDAQKAYRESVHSIVIRMKRTDTPSDCKVAEWLGEEEPDIGKLGSVTFEDPCNVPPEVLEYCDTKGLGIQLFPMNADADSR